MMELQFFVNIAPVVCLVAIAMGCVCGCRKQVPKNELLGLAGMVKITNPDDDYNYNTPQQVTVTSETPDRNSYNSHKRANGCVVGGGGGGVSSGGGGVSRSLPDLPVGPSAVPDVYPDTTSDLYATLDLDGEGRKCRDDDLIEEETVDTAGSPSYAQPSEERYARVGSEEHIAAASAIAGIVPANHDLPYMTPPPQPNFSGDSHDSHKGYTSISVREPLSRIMMATGGSGRAGASHPHYATLSDVDSDDMYAAIEENNGAPGSETYARIGGVREAGDYATSESETYAQIGPRFTSQTGRGECREENGGGEYGTSGSETYAQIAPRPSLHDPPLSLTNQGVTCSNDTSPVSLRKEKREANSPLPEPPSPVGNESLSKLLLPDPPSPLDAMYAKVIKKQKSSDSNSASPSPSSPLPQVEPNELIDRHYESLECPCTSEPPYEKIQESRTKESTASKVGGPTSILCEAVDISSTHYSLSTSSGGLSSSLEPPSNESSTSIDRNISVSIAQANDSTSIDVSTDNNLSATSTDACGAANSVSVTELYAQVNKSPTQR